MQIKVTQTKTKDARVIGQGEFHVSVQDARDRHLMADFLRGGSVVELDSTHVVVRTEYPDYTNLIALSGSYEDMEPLCEIAKLWSAASVKYPNEAVELAIQESRKLFNEDDIREVPFVSTLATSAIGSARLRIAAMLAVGITEKQDVRHGLTLRIDELIEGIKRSKEGMTPFPAALAR